MYDFPMDATAKTTNTLELGELVQHKDYTIQEAGTVQLGKTVYRVRLQQLEAKGDYAGELLTWLIGPRGAEYILQPLSMFESTGKYRVMSFNTGAFLRRQGNEVKVFMLGNIIEEI